MKTIIGFDGSLDDRLTFGISDSFIETAYLRKACFADDDHGFEKIGGFEAVLELEKQVDSICDSVVRGVIYIWLKAGSKNIGSGQFETILDSLEKMRGETIIGV